MYHPAARTDGKQVEFIEIFNTEPVWHDIGGFRLSGAVDFFFPAGTILEGASFLVVAQNPADLEGEYGLSNVFGPYFGALGNRGEAIRLHDEQDTIVLEIPYSDDYPWPEAADGAGHSLWLARPDYGEGDSRAWSASSERGGSPGEPDPETSSAYAGVMINEFLSHTDLPQVDFVELYNHGAQSVDISDCTLSDDPDLDIYTIPPGTTIPAGGFASFSQTTLSFSLSKHGGTIYLRSPDRTALDVVKFEPQAEGVSSGRYPDGAPTFHALTDTTEGAANTNASLLTNDIVINEIMYHPLSGLNDDDYVELFNKGTASVDISSWRFRDGIRFTVPAGTVIPAGGYLVVAENAAHLIATYPGLDSTNTLGDWSGNLSDRGERIALTRPRDMDVPDQDFVVVDEVTYGDSDTWGTWTDGGGSSLELVDPDSDNRLAMNWRGSDESAKSRWTTIQYTGLIDNGFGTCSELHMFMQQAGECLIDDVSVVNETTSSEWFRDDFESGLGNWAFEHGNHIRSSILTGGGFRGSDALYVRASGKGEGHSKGVHGLWDAQFNQLAVARTPAFKLGQTVTVRARARWIAGWPYVALVLQGSYLEAAGRMNIPEDLGTPGAVNSRWAENAGPAVSDVSHNPVMPPAHQPVVVTARVQDADGIGGVSVHYRVDPASDITSVAMTDDGLGGDEVAGDGIYSAALPGQASRKLIVFYVEASDGSATSRFPEDAPARECLVRFGASPAAGDFESYTMWMTDAV